jgi:chemotaxis protein methyltransferase CheR
MKRNLTVSELSKVCEVIAAKMGLHFPVERWAMLGRNLATAAQEFGFPNMDAFIQLILSAELTRDQLKQLASHLTISETYFWREPQVFSALTDCILPELINSKKNEEKCIKIWSVGCSTGEEPYSLAIALHRAIPDIKGWKISILATDINPKALEKAEAGIYRPWSFRNTPDWLIKSYFNSLEDRKLEIVPEIKKMVTFSNHNLTENDDFSVFGGNMDIIFCRNVLMYFTNDWVSKISQNLFHSLSEDGWFVVSSTELSSQVFPQFIPVNFPGAVLYRKTKNRSVKFSPGFAGQSPLHPAMSQTLTKDGYPPLPFVFVEPGTPRTKSGSFIDRLNEVKLAAKDEIALPMETINVPKEVSSEAFFYQPGEIKVLPVEEQSGVKPPAEASADKIFTIRLLANQNYLSEALSLCNEAIASEKLDSGFYFLRASILQEMEKSTEAIASLKQAIYIDPGHIMGHFTLGNLFNQQGNVKNAKRHFNNTLDLLNRCENDDILPESEGLSVRYIREIIFANMQTIRTK